MFRLVYSRLAEKQLAKLSAQTALRILKGCERLNTKPFPDDKHVKKLKGYHALYRLRIGDYRVVFTIAGQMVEVIDIISKQDFQNSG